MRERLLWIAVGAVCLVLAAALGFATSKLTEAPVGLSAEPVSAGEALAPAPTATPERPEPTPSPTAEPESEDSSGSDDDDDDSGRGRGRGRSGDDD